MRIGSDLIVPTPHRHAFDELAQGRKLDHFERMTRTDHSFDRREVPALIRCIGADVGMRASAHCWPEAFVDGLKDGDAAGVIAAIAEASGALQLR